MPFTSEHNKLIPVIMLALAIAFADGCGKDRETDSPARAGAMKPGTGDTAPVKTVSKGGGPTGDPEAGKAVYEKYCFYCHGRRGEGDGPVGLTLAPHPADFVHDKARMAKTDEELLKSITEGIQRETGGESMSMPRWKEIITEKERRDVLAYVRKLERDGKKRPAQTKAK